MQTDLPKVDIFGSLERITAPNIQDLEQLYLSHALVIEDSNVICLCYYNINFAVL